MTQVTFKNGLPVMRGGQVVTSKDCCCGDCLCCSCVERVYYSPGTPGANAQPFAGIAPAGGSWAWDSTLGVYYGEFPCHYVEYAFSEYAASIFPNAANAGADAAYSGGGTWWRGNPYIAEFGETRCTGSTEEDCQPCLAYPGTLPSGDPLPTLAQLQKQCGIYHPCTPCESCSNAVDGCGVPGINQSQGLFSNGNEGGRRWPEGIPWPPPDGTCPCKLCDLLCIMAVRVTWKSKMATTIIDGRHWPEQKTNWLGITYCDFGPIDGPPSLSELTLPPNTVLIWGRDADYYDNLGWNCNTAIKRQSMYPQPQYDSGYQGSFGYPCYPNDSSLPPEETEWWDQELEYVAYYHVVRTVSDCGACQSYDIDSASSAEALGCGGIKQIEAAPSYYFQDVPYDAAQWFKWEPANCDFPFACGIACWDVAENPFL